MYRSWYVFSMFVYVNAFVCEIQWYCVLSSKDAVKDNVLFATNNIVISYYGRSLRIFDQVVCYSEYNKVAAEL